MPHSLSGSLRLPTIKLEPFKGNIEEWSRFWEQFQSSVDQNSSVSQIDKHVFLRGYLEGEPKRIVDGIAVTAATYEETKRILQVKYGDKNRIIQTHLDFLEQIKPIHPITPESLNNTYVECNRRLQALRALGENVDGYGRILAPKILRVFSEDICRRWIIYAKRENLSEGNITRLMEFLNDEVEGALTAQKIRGDNFQVDSFLPTTATFQVSTKSKKLTRSSQFTEPFCAFCERRGHWAQDCKEVTTVKERIEKLKRSSRCFLCLNRGHGARNCSKRGKIHCSKCKKSHHYSICTMHDITSTTVNTIDTQSPDFTHLQTACIRIIGPTGLSKLTRCVLDGGSQSSFICKSLVDTLHLNIVDERDVRITTFESDITCSQKRRIACFQLKGLCNSSSVTITAFESHNTFSTHPTIPQDVSLLANFRKLPLADPKDNSNLPIELLIGGDHYWKLIKDTLPIRISPSLVLLPSIFGWILSGNRSGVTVNQVNVNKIELQQELPILDSHVRNFWDLEAMGIKDSESRSLSTKDATILRDFHKSFRIENGRRTVSLPRTDHTPTTDNRINAKKRFESLARRLQNNDNYRKLYNDKMLEYICQQQVEEVAPESQAECIYYLPHHAVRKEKQGSTKWRIVFDASSHENGSPSLNDSLESGPNLLPEVLTVLLQFRFYQYALLGDVSQAFLQLSLDSADRDLTRFFWYRVIADVNGLYHTTDEVTTYRFTRLPFGLTCSPFLLSATLRELATMYNKDFPTATTLINRSMYMDDFAASNKDENELSTIYSELTALMNIIHLPMAKWATNSTSLLRRWEAEGLAIHVETQVLGMDWNTELDVFSISPTAILKTLSERPATKRHLLQITSRIYDPLGLFSPVTIFGKLLFQDTWLRGTQWKFIAPRAAWWGGWCTAKRCIRKTLGRRQVDEETLNTTVISIEAAINSRPSCKMKALLQEDVRQRHLWKRPRIEELRRGRDNKIRTVVLRTPEGLQITRPVQLIIPLEVDQGGEDVEE